MKAAISLIFFCGTVCYAQHISSTELINKAKEYDGKSVVYAGEVIGDVMERGDSVWVNLNDGENAIGIWLDKELAEEIKYTGSYQTKGDRLEVTGVFHRSCIQHGGDMDIHAQFLRKISPGELVKEQLHTGKRNLTIILLGILCLVLIFLRRRGSRPSRL
jgi:hypothetical protein